MIEKTNVEIAAEKIAEVQPLNVKVEMLLDAFVTELSGDVRAQLVAKGVDMTKFDSLISQWRAMKPVLVDAVVSKKTTIK